MIRLFAAPRTGAASEMHMPTGLPLWVSAPAVDIRIPVPRPREGADR
jgi:hypothetical protein